MKIKTLRLENFQGIARAEFEFGGSSASIYGDNATGKTTVFNAVTWLLFDKASTGAKNFSPKTMGAGGSLHNLNHAAEAVCIMDGGSLVTFRKDFHEVYKKKRGSATETFDGHTVDYFIDGVPVKEKEYATTVQAFCGGMERMKMLTMPDYFAEAMTWDARRKILLELCGDISDKDIIQADPDLHELWDFIQIPGTIDQRYAVEDYRKKAEAQRREVNRQLDGIPGRIDEAKRAIPSGTEDVSFIPSALEQLGNEREDLLREQAAVLAGDGAVTEARKRTAEAEAALANARNAFLTRSGADRDAILNQISKVSSEMIVKKANADDLNRTARQKKDEADRLTAMRDSLTKEWFEQRKSAFNREMEVCDKCGQRLPQDRIASLIEEFNLRKSRKLEEIQLKGKQECSEGMIAVLREEAKAAEEAAAAASEEACALQEKIDALRGELSQQPIFETTEEYASCVAVISVCRAAEASAGKDTSKATEAVSAKLRATEKEIQSLQELRLQNEQAETQRKRVQELEDQEHRLAEEAENLAHGIYLCDEFVKAKVRMLTEKIDSKFKAVRFRLFQEQLNGGVKEDCEVLVPGEGGRLVPFPFANNAARINAGLEIIDALSQHWEMEMPVFIDNAESVTHLAPSHTQTIRLVVSEQDKQLRLELNSATGN